MQTDYMGKDRVKTDKRDAKKLAEQLSDGRLESIYIPSVEEELLRLFTRLRRMKHALPRYLGCEE